MALPILGWTWTWDGSTWRQGANRAAIEIWYPNGSVPRPIIRRSSQEFLMRSLQIALISLVFAIGTCFAQRGGGGHGGGGGGHAVGGGGGGGGFRGGAVGGGGRSEERRVGKEGRS